MTIASRSDDSSSMSERTRRSFSPNERSMFETSERTSVSSSPARASARSMPSPIEAISRRIACDSVTICSVAIASGSARRTATCIIERAVMRTSWVRRVSAAVMKKKRSGPTIASATSAVFGCRTAEPASSTRSA